MKVAAFRSLRRKLLLPLFVGGVIVAGAVVWGIQVMYQRQYEEALFQRGQIVANMVDHVTEGISRPGELQRIVAAIGGEQGVLQIVVLGGKPMKVLASTRNAWVGKRLSELPSLDVAEDLDRAMKMQSRHHHYNHKEHIYDVSTPLMLSQSSFTDGRVRSAGAVTVHLDTRASEAAVIASTQRLSAEILGAISVLTVLGYGLLNSMVLRPIKTIAQLVTERPNEQGRMWAKVVSGDEIGRLACLLRDSLERTESALRDLEIQKFALDQHALVSVMDRDGKLTYVNDHLCAVSGYKREELLGQDKGILGAKIQRKTVFVEMEQKICAGGVWQGELCDRTKGGELFWVDTTIVPLLGLDGKPREFIAIRADITARKRSEAELQRLNQEMVGLSRQAGMAEVAISVLHNIGNVLNSINVSATLLSDQVSRSKRTKTPGLIKLVKLFKEHELDLADFFARDERAKHVVTYLDQLAQHLDLEQRAMLEELEGLRKNIDHIKDVVTMQQSYAKVSGFMETIDVVDLVEHALRMHGETMSRDGVEVVREFEPIAMQEMDKHKVLQILVNLLRNARHACIESGNSEKRVTVKVGIEGEALRISVQDNGVGIAPENIKRIFNHGFTTKPDGHGFGLHSGALAAREMGGVLRFDSAGIGLGACFTLELPLRTSLLAISGQDSLPLV